MYYLHLPKPIFRKALQKAYVWTPKKQVMVGEGIIMESGPQHQNNDGLLVSGI